MKRAMRILADCTMQTKKDLMWGEMLVAVSGDKMTLRSDRHGIAVTVPYSGIAGIVEEVGQNSEAIGKEGEEI